MNPSDELINVLMVGAGEYNCGYVPTSAGAAADKKAGVVAIVLFDLRRQGRLGRILLCDAVGKRLPLARACMKSKIENVYADMRTDVECFPADDVDFDGNAYLTAMDTMSAGDVVIVFTPDDTHFPIAMAAMNRKLHVLIAKPIVKTLDHHQELETFARTQDVLCAVEYHKRWDPIYNDACERSKALGSFSYFYSCMTQRREQLDTFRAWAGISSDISFYLNSHHMDVHCWFLEGTGSRPTQVVAASSTGVANKRLGRSGVDDTISVLVTWENADGSTGHATYMSSWIAPTADCHTQQQFHYVGHEGEMRVDQAHRGYNLSASESGGGTGALAAINPLYMRYVPDSRGRFAGQHGYGYKSIEAFVDAARDIRGGASTVATIEREGVLATVSKTKYVTAILEACRISLDAGSRPVRVLHEGDGEATVKLALL